MDTQVALGDLHSFLLDLASYVLEEDVTFHDGETIGFTEAASAHLPQRRCLARRHDAEDQLSGGAVTAPPAYANAPAVKAAGAFVNNACAASAPGRGSRR